MEINSIDQVHEAESEAERLIKEANKTAAEIVAKADEEALNLISEAEMAAYKDAENKLETVHAENRKKSEKSTAEIADEIASLNQSAHAAQPKAVQMIIEALG